MNNEERVRLIEDLINMMYKDDIVLKLITKELEYLKVKETTTGDELKSKLIELLQLANNIKVMENLCLNGLVKL